MSTTTATHTTDTRKRLGLEYGQVVTLSTRVWEVTGTVTPTNNGWLLTGGGVPGHLPAYGHATKVTVVR
jgi:hypothetical protein